MEGIPIDLTNCRGRSHWPRLSLRLAAGGIKVLLAESLVRLAVGIPNSALSGLSIRTVSSQQCRSVRSPDSVLSGLRTLHCQQSAMHVRPKSRFRTVRTQHSVLSAVSNAGPSEVPIPHCPHSAFRIVSSQKCRSVRSPESAIGGRWSWAALCSEGRLFTAKWSRVASCKIPRCSCSHVRLHDRNRLASRFARRVS